MAIKKKVIKNELVIVVNWQRVNTPTPAFKQLMRALLRTPGKNTQKRKESANGA